MTEIVTAAIATIATNPFRRLHDYPYIPSKIDALQRSIAGVGLWASVMARPFRRLGQYGETTERQKQTTLWKFELAFGHHRVEAARRSGLKEIPLIVDELTDRQMLEYMGRENLEDYNAVFLIQLESWEAAIKSGLLSATTEKRNQDIEIAKLLGWYEVGESGAKLNNTARACRAAYALISSGELLREDFVDQSVRASLLIAERAMVRIEQLEERSKGSAYSRKEIDQARRHIGRGAVDTLKQAREGRVSQNDLRASVDFNAANRASRAAKPSPLFAVFANAVADNLRRTLNNDADAEKLSQVEKVLSQISMMEDWEALRRVDLELLNLGERTNRWRQRLTPSKEKVIHFKALEGGRGEP